MSLRKDIENAINRNSAENGSDTPDYILAAYLTDCLAAYDTAVTAREKWYGRDPKPVDFTPGSEPPPPPPTQKPLVLAPRELIEQALVNVEMNRLSVHDSNKYLIDPVIKGLEEVLKGDDQ